MRIFFLSTALALVLVAPADPQVSGERDPSRAKMRSRPHPEPVAKVRLLMLGINLPNFQGIEQSLSQEPRGTDAWDIIQGQALLIAENGNLLMLRPPTGAKEDAWLDRAAELRSAGARLARAAVDHDYARCRDDLTRLANVCNRCHKSFQVNANISAFGEQSGIPAVPRPPAPPSVPQPPVPPQPPRPPGDGP
jgi:hypothetical protein